MVEKIIYISLTAIGAVLLIAIGFLVAKRMHKKRMHKIKSGLNNSKKNLNESKSELEAP